MSVLISRGSSCRSLRSKGRRPRSWSGIKFWASPCSVRETSRKVDRMEIPQCSGLLAQYGVLSFGYQRRRGAAPPSIQTIHPKALSTLLRQVERMVVRAAAPTREGNPDVRHEAARVHHAEIRRG